MTLYVVPPLEGVVLSVEAENHPEALRKVRAFLRALVGQAKEQSWIADPQPKEEEPDEDLIERAAEAIFLYSACDPADWDVAVGGPKRVWKLAIGIPWDQSPLELNEWERDDYRRMARAALAAMEKS
jgi:hypothetical protein